MELHPISKSDVTWIDKDGKRYKLHSIILSIQSKVFSEMYESKEVVEHEMDFPSITLEIIIKLMYNLHIEKTIIFDNIVNLWKFAHQYDCTLETYIIDLITSHHSFDKFENWEISSYEKPIIENNILPTMDYEKHYLPLFQFAYQVKEKNVIRYFLHFFVTHRSFLYNYFKSEIKLGDEFDSAWKISPCETFESKQIVFQPEPKNKHDVFWIDTTGCEYHLHAVLLQHLSPIFLEMYKETRVFYGRILFPTESLKAFCEVIYDSKSVSNLTSEILIEVFKISVYFKCCSDIIWLQILNHYSYFDIKQLCKLIQIVILSRNKDYISSVLLITHNATLYGALLLFFGAEVQEMD